MKDVGREKEENWKKKKEMVEPALLGVPAVRDPRMQCRLAGKQAH